MIEVDHLIKTLRCRHRSGRREFSSGVGTDSRVPRPERGRQDNHHAHHHRLHACHQGKATVAGFDVFEQPLEAKRRTGYLPETPPLYPDMTVREYLTFVAKIKGVHTHVRDRVDEVMKRTWVADMASRHCCEALEGLQAARRPGAGHHPQSRRAGARRAHGRSRPQADHRDPSAHSRARRHAHHRSQHPHPPGSGADLPAGRHHQQGQGRRGGHAGQPHVADAGRGHDVSAV